MVLAILASLLIPTIIQGCTLTRMLQHLLNCSNGLASKEARQCRTRIINQLRTRSRTHQHLHRLSTHKRRCVLLPTGLRLRQPVIRLKQDRSLRAPRWVVVKCCSSSSSQALLDPHLAPSLTGVALPYARMHPSALLDLPSPVQLAHCLDALLRKIATVELRSRTPSVHQPRREARKAALPRTSLRLLSTAPRMPTRSVTWVTKNLRTSVLCQSCRTLQRPRLQIRPCRRLSSQMEMCASRRTKILYMPVNGRNFGVLWIQNRTAQSAALRSVAAAEVMEIL